MQNCCDIRVGEGAYGTISLAILLRVLKKCSNFPLHIAKGILEIPLFESFVDDKLVWLIIQVVIIVLKVDIN
jgi:hypothetical protein